VLGAASRLFVERGWAATTLGAVAAEAGTAIETVYAGFGSKSGLLTAAIDMALAGDEAQVPLSERPEYALIGVGARQDRLCAAAHVISAAHGRSMGLLRALREAAASDPGCAARWDRYEADRRSAIEAGLGLVLGRRPPERLTDPIWALACPEVFDKLVEVRGWTVAHYEAWLVEMADALIGRAERRRR
jgi:AcrR family transcriptional regulator